jgi:ATP-binding cassette, subfamily B, bacterial MsbA
MEPSERTLGMRNFLRALKVSWPYRYRIMVSFLAAICVALLWSINLSAIYPVLTILSEDKNLQQWVDQEIKILDEKSNDPKRHKEIREARELINFLNQNPPGTFENKELRERTHKLAVLEGELEDTNRRLFRLRMLKDHVIAYLPEGRFETFAWIIGCLLLGLAVKGFFEFWQETLVGSVVTRTVYDMRNRFFRSALHQDVRQIQEVGTSEMMARTTNDLEQVGAGMKILYGKMVVEPLKAIGCIVAACLISWQLTLLFIFLVAPAVITLGRVSRSMKKASRKVLEQMSDLYRIVREAFDGIRVVKAFTMEPSERRRFRQANDTYYRRAMRVIRLDAIAGPIVEVLGVGAVALALLAGAYLVLEKKTGITMLGVTVTLTDSELSFKALLQLYLFLGMVADPVRRLSSVFTKIQAGAAAADRVFALADRQPKVMPNADGPTVPKHSKAVEFRNVCFSYVPGMVPGTLNNVDLLVDAGETVAIVGPNGCGKSTLVGLLSRFFDPDYGAVFVDGVNLRTANLRSLRKQIGMVTQDTILFNDTIFANIAYGRPGATREEVEAAAKQAFAHEFIVDRPKGYDEVVGDSGFQVSGGQRQRIALARAILRDPRILILDEFTSQIDAESEQKIHQALKTFIEGRTTFIITHRMSTLEVADRIIVMDAGHIVAAGPHTELLMTCNVYQRLFEAQSDAAKLRVA